MATTAQRTRRQLKRGIAKSATATEAPALDSAAALAARDQLCRSFGRIYKRSGNLYLDAFPGEPTIDTGAMSATFPISTPTEDRSEDIVDPEGLFLDNYRLNPVVMYDHGFGSLDVPIGKSEAPDGSLAIAITPMAVTGTCFFSQSLLEAQQIFALVEEKILRAASPLIIEKDFSIRPGTGRNKKRPGLFIKTWDMGEWSIVGVPCNPEATRKVLDRRTLAGSPIAEPILKSLRLTAAPIPVQGRGFDPAKVSTEAFTLASLLTPRPTIMSMAKSISKSAKGGDEEEMKKRAKEFEERDDVKSLTKEYSDIKDDDSDKAKSRRKEIEDEYKALRKSEGLSEDDSQIPERPGEGRPEPKSEDEPDGDEVTPLGSQILGAAHAALSEVSDQIEQAIKPLENPQVKEYADGLVDEMRGHMANINDLHKSEYGEELSKGEEEGTADPNNPNNNPPEAGAMVKFLARAKSHRLGIRGLANQLLTLSQSKKMPRGAQEDLGRISRRLFAITKAAEKGAGTALSADEEQRYRDLEAKVDELTVLFQAAIPNRR